MNKIFRTGLLLTLSAGLLAMLPAQNDAVAKITFPLNQVFVISAGSTELQQAGFQMELFEGDKIETKKESRCEITFVNGDVVRIDENSLFTIEKVEVTPETRKAESSLGAGKLWSTIKKVFKENDQFKVKAPSAVIAVRGTIYRVDVDPDSSTRLRVYEGNVEVAPQAAASQMAPGQQQPTKQGEAPRQIGPPRDVPGPDDVAGPRDVSEETWLEIVKAQQQIVVRPDGSYQKSSFDPEQDAQSDWVKWNKERDELLQR
ncbi:MAG: FecR domain-containing protein [Calditrichia bacterium]